MPRPRSPPRAHRPLLGLALLAAIAPSVLASPVLHERATEEGGYYNPTTGGGQWLTLARDTGGLGEPINVVVSADSDPRILTSDGLGDWSISMNFGTYLLDGKGVGSYAGECLGQSDGARQAANLGDGNGMHNQTALFRENFGDVTYGVCRETSQGGYHYRYWQQSGPAANSSAWFFAASEEENLNQGHMITPNGYDRGRDEVVRRATISGGSKSPVTNRTYEATARNASGPGYYANISTSDINHGIATDGIVAVLTVRVTSDPTTASAKGTSAAASSSFVLAQAAGLGLFSLFALSLLA